jgi:hypothetical protein
MSKRVYLHGRIDNEGRLMLYDQHGRELGGVVSAEYRLTADGITRVVAEIELADGDGNLFTCGQVMSGDGLASR